MSMRLIGLAPASADSFLAHRVMSLPYKKPALN